MTQKPIDAHCHLFSARYVVEEAAAMGWAYVTGNYPMLKPSPRPRRPPNRCSPGATFWDIFKRFLDLGAPVGSYEMNHLDLVEAHNNSGTLLCSLKPKVVPSVQTKNVIDGILKLCFVYLQVIIPFHLLQQHLILSTTSIGDSFLNRQRGGKLSWPRGISEENSTNAT